MGSWTNFYFGSWRLQVCTTRRVQTPRKKYPLRSSGTELRLGDGSLQQTWTRQVLSPEQFEPGQSVGSLHRSQAERRFGWEKALVDVYSGLCQLYGHIGSPSTSHESPFCPVCPFNVCAIISAHVGRDKEVAAAQTVFQILCRNSLPIDS